MMLPILILLVSLLDIKHPPVNHDLIRDLTVNEIVDETTTECTENPSFAGLMDQTLKIELVEPIKPEDVLNTPSPDHRIISQDAKDAIHNVRPMVVPVKPPIPDPDPQPKEPPSVLTPEPAMLAILSITGVMLLFFLFGRRAGRRFSRRI